MLYCVGIKRFIFYSLKNQLFNLIHAKKKVNMLKKGNNRAISCSREFGQWLFMSLMTLVLLSAFPIMGSANDSYIVGVVFLDANENGVYDPDEPVRVGHDVYLKDLNGGNFHTPTNEKGEFYFTARHVGDYEISTICS